MRVRGVGGEIRAGSRVAATLGTWALERPPDALGAGRWTVEAIVRDRDAYWSAHGAPFDLAVPAGGIAWVWRGVRVDWGERAVTISGTGSPEVGAWHSDSSCATPHGSS